MGMLFVAILVLSLDQVTKYLAALFLADVTSKPIIESIFHLTLVHNPGIAFGLFSRGGLPLTLLILACLIFLTGMALKMRSASLLERISLGMLIGGAAGNLMDRIRLGHVIDFLDFRVWPVFNLADSFITVGVILFLLMGMKKSHVDHTI